MRLCLLSRALFRREADRKNEQPHPVLTRTSRKQVLTDLRGLRPLALSVVVYDLSRVVGPGRPETVVDGGPNSTGAINTVPVRNETVSLGSLIQSIKVKREA